MAFSSMRRCVVVAGWLMACAAGCTAPRRPLVVTDPDPSVKIPAVIKHLDRTGTDLATLRQLVGDLDSDDPAVRLYVINALEQITGDRFGYQYYHDEIQRRPALARWQQWLAEQEDGKGSATQPVVKSGNGAP